MTAILYITEKNTKNNSFQNEKTFLMNLSI